MTAVIGVDGGISGAIALVTGGGHVIVQDVPTFGDTRRILDARAYVDLLRSWNVMCGPAEAFFERGAEIPFVAADGRKQRQASMYPYGFTNGQTYMGAIALGIPATIVDPQTWKRHFRLLGKDKEASRAKAIELYPDATPLLHRKKDHNRAEAVLIARYGLDTMTGDLR